MKVFLVLSLIVVARICVAYSFGDFDRAELANHDIIPLKELPIYRFLIQRVHECLPSPHSQLLLGMTIGYDDLGSVKRFKEFLIKTGTVHVVVVSGFNINLMFDFVKKLIGSTYRKRNLLVALALTLLYALISGFKPPVIRAWLMCSVVNIGKYYGRSIEALQTLFFTALIMLLFNPLLLSSLSFQLSFLSTLGLTVICPVVSQYFGYVIKKPTWFMQDLYTTLSANLAVLPLISYNFDRISLSGLLVNPLILWSVPLVTVLGLCLLPLIAVKSVVAQLCGLILYPLLDCFVKIVEYAAHIFGDVNYKIPLWCLVAYYVLLFISIKLLDKRCVEKNTTF